MSEWDSFTSDVEKGSHPKRTGCTLGQALQGLSRLNRIQVDAALTRTDVTTTSITRELAARGFNFPYFTVRRHRLGQCSCETNGQ